MTPFPKLWKLEKERKCLIYSNILLAIFILKYTQIANIPIFMCTLPTELNHGTHMILCPVFVT